MGGTVFQFSSFPGGAWSRDALKFGVWDRYGVRVVLDGDGELTFGDVFIRGSLKCSPAMYLDTDEANGADISTCAIGRINGIQRKSPARI